MLSDEKITLRALEPEDLDWLYRIENDTELWRWGNANVPYSRYVLKRYIAESQSDIYADGQLRLAIVSSDTGQVMGCVDLTAFDARHLRAEVGILLFPEFRGFGYGLRVLDLLGAYCRRHLHLHLLYAVVSAANSPASRLFLRAGYARSAELRDWLRMDDGRYASAFVFTLPL